jgi:hypothetical protein
MKLPCTGSLPRPFNKEKVPDSVRGALDAEEQVSGLSAVSVLSAALLFSALLFPALLFSALLRAAYRRAPES